MATTAQRPPAPPAGPAPVATEAQPTEATLPPGVTALLEIVGRAQELMANLITTLADEVGAVSTMGRDAPSGFAEAKTRFSAALQITLEELGQVSADDRAHPTASAALKALEEDFRILREAANHNAAALQGAIDANRMMLDLIAETARTQQPRTAGYGRTGAAASGGGAYRSPGAQPVMLTRKL